MSTPGAGGKAFKVWGCGDLGLRVLDFLALGSRVLPCLLLARPPAENMHKNRKKNAGKILSLGFRRG